MTGAATASNDVTNEMLAQLFTERDRHAEDRVGAASQLSTARSTPTHIELSGQVLCGSVRFDPPPPDWYRDPQHVARVLRQFDISAAPGDPFDCVIPGALDGTQARIDPERLTYVRFAKPPAHYLREEMWLHLAEVHASLIAGRLVQLRPKPDASGRAWILLMRWSDSLACEVGLAKTDVKLYQPPGLTADELHVAHRFGQLFAINAHHHGPVPLMFGRAFATDWTGLSERRVKCSLRHLRELDVIRCVDGSQRVNLYVPGDGSQPCVFGVAQGPPPKPTGVLWTA